LTCDPGIRFIAPGGWLFFYFRFVQIEPLRSVQLFPPKKSVGHANVRRWNGEKAVKPCLGGAADAFRVAETVPDKRVVASVACRVLRACLMIIEVTHFDSQEFNDSHFFQRLTLIDICCGPPANG